MVIKRKHYSTKQIDETGAHYRLIYGMRSPGKTTCLLIKALQEYCKTGKQFGYMRRWEADMKTAEMEQLFDLINSGLAFDPDTDEKIDLWEMTDHKYDRVVFSRGRFILARREEQANGEMKLIKDGDPCGFTFALTKSQHYKGEPYPKVTRLIFDEFISESMYLPDEFTKFMSIVSSISRDREDLVIYLLGNTVNTECPYFRDFRLTKYQKKMKIGDIVFVSDPERLTTFAMEWTEKFDVAGRVMNVYADFDSPVNEMINGGAWQLDNYPHLPEAYDIMDVVYTFYVEYYEDIMEGEVIVDKEKMYVYLHRKTTPLKYEEGDLVYSNRINLRPQVSNSFFRPRNELEKKIATLYLQDQFVYQDNELGDCFKNFINDMKKRAKK